VLCFTLLSWVCFKPSRIPENLLFVAPFSRENMGFHVYVSLTQGMWVWGPTFGLSRNHQNDCHFSWENHPTKLQLSSAIFDYRGWYEFVSLPEMYGYMYIWPLNKGEATHKPCWIPLLRHSTICAVHKTHGVWWWLLMFSWTMLIQPTQTVIFTKRNSNHGIFVPGAGGLGKKVS
jgi:hypothetical protein